jgi:transposase
LKPAADKNNLSADRNTNSLQYGKICLIQLSHYRINHSKLFADKQNHINGIENFWNQAKRHMRKFNSVPKSHFPLFLKECEWRFNNPKPKSQLKQLKLVKQYMG